MASRVRGSSCVFVYFSEARVPSIGRLLSGEVGWEEQRRQPVMVSLVTGRETLVGRRTLELVQRLGTDDWTPVELIVERGWTDRSLVETLVRHGLLVGDGEAREEAELRRREELISKTAWNRYAALYHFTSGWEGVDLEETFESGDEESLDEFVSDHGVPPPPFKPRCEGARVTPLPPPRERGSLRDILLARRTTRDLEPRGRLDLARLSTLLSEVWGCHGVATFGTDRLEVLKKTSPSGGCLHPVEVYPLVVRVDGLPSGLYHYGVRDHALERIRELDGEVAAELARCLVAGQAPLQGAAVLFIMAARFYRNFWKYRQHAKAYGVLLMDVAHLSQTFYLVCADLGLGAFYTAAVNNRDAERELGLDGYEEGVLGISGCGLIGESSGKADPVFELLEAASDAGRG